MHTEKENKDLAMYRKVRALSDLEICQHLAEIEGLQTYIQYDSVRINVPEGDDYYFNPLANCEQLMALMRKHDINLIGKQYVPKFRGCMC